MPAPKAPVRRRRSVACGAKLNVPSENLKVNFCTGMKTYSLRQRIQQPPAKICAKKIIIPPETFKVHLYAGMKTYLHRKSNLTQEAIKSPEVVESTMNTNPTSNQTEVKTPNYICKSKNKSISSCVNNETLNGETSNKTVETESKNQDVEKRRSVDKNDNLSCGETISSESEHSEIEKTPDSFLDSEAIETGNYVSGESQDEEERRYIAENEIPVRGETISSESAISSNSDYERDSFVVSSDPEDYELLDTSSDLGDSDNELKMNKHSKQKYNDRKIKEQKAASREMFLARHGPHPKYTSTPKSRVQLRCSEIPNQRSANEEDSTDTEVINRNKKCKNVNGEVRNMENEALSSSQISSDCLDDHTKIRKPKKTLKRRSTLRIESSDSEDSTETNFTRPKRKTPRRLDSDSQSANDETSIDVVDDVLIDKKESPNETQREPSQNIVITTMNVLNNVKTLVSETTQSIKDNSFSGPENKAGTNFINSILMQNKAKPVPVVKVTAPVMKKCKNLNGEDRNIKNEPLNSSQISSDCLDDHTKIRKPMKTLKRRSTLRIESSDSEASTETNFTRPKRKIPRRLDSDSQSAVDETNIDVVDDVLIDKKEFPNETQPGPSQNIASTTNNVQMLVSETTQNIKEKSISGPENNTETNLINSKSMQNETNPVPVVEVTAPVAETSENLVHHSDSSTSSIDITALLPKPFRKRPKKIKKSPESKEKMRTESTNISEPLEEPVREVSRVISTMNVSVESVAAHVGVIQPASTTAFRILVEEIPHLCSLNQ